MLVVLLCRSAAALLSLLHAPSDASDATNKVDLF